MTEQADRRVEWLVAHGAHLQWREVALKLRRPPGLSARERERLLEAMMETDGLQGACREAGVTLGMVLGERLRNRAFRRVWEKAQAERRAILETLLTDLVVRGLLPDPERSMGESREKFLAGLARTLSEGEAAAVPKRGRAPAPRPPAPRATPTDGDELLKLVADVERRISAAEAGHEPVRDALSSPEC